MFKLEGGLLLNLYPRTDLARDAAIPVGPPQSGEFSLAQLVRSREEVDALLEKAASAGATVTPGHDRPWGIYSGYFRDPDGHLWEIILRPNRSRRAALQVLTPRPEGIRQGDETGHAAIYSRSFLSRNRRTLSELFGASSSRRL